MQTTQFKRMLFKQEACISMQQKKQEMLLQAQKKRKERIEKLRHEQDDEEMQSEQQETSTILRKRQKHALQYHDWMLMVPPNLHTDWLVCARPQGHRYLVHITTKNKITIRHAFQHQVKHIYCKHNMPMQTVLDCVMYEQQVNHDKDEDVEMQEQDLQMYKFFIQDVLVWNGMEMVDCEAEFRYAWLKSNLVNDALFHLIPQFPVTNAHLQALYHANQMPTASSPVTYQCDGLLFTHKQSHYCGNEPVTPLCLVWKDLYCSPFLQNTLGKDDKICMFLQVAQDQVHVETCDHISLGIAENTPPNLPSGTILQCELQLFANQHIAVKCLANKSKQKSKAEPYSKIMFHLVHANIPTIQALLQ